MSTSATSRPFAHTTTAQTATEKVVDEALLDALDRMLDAMHALAPHDSGMAKDLKAPIKAVTELLDWNRANPGWTRSLV